MSSTFLELQPLELLPGNLLRPSALLKSSSASSTSTFPLMEHSRPKSPATQPSNSGATRSTQYSSATRCSLPALTPPSTASLTFAASPASASAPRG
ncbi:hypothetical protein RBB78_11005 [Tunturiibacter empetritectus]|uniref:hypothetical protein n=1 Tax=Tunturiibacter empetritectus TaxID=3069691 RepID=UPI003D9B29A3